MKKIFLIVENRPNYIKAFPLYKKLKSTNNNVNIIHTGQHYDYKMNQIFFDELGIDKPDIFLETKSTSSIKHFCNIMTKLEDLFLIENPDMVIVFGDVNSSLAAALVSNQMKIKLVHIESGLRSFDKTMPEENNRILIDNISDYLFVTEESGIENLKKENITKNVYLVGNTMIDTLYQNLNTIQQRKYYKKLKLTAYKYLLVTIHRPSNVDNDSIFKNNLKILNELSNDYTIIYPIHPRYKKRINDFNINFNNNLFLIDLFLYIDFINLMYNSYAVLTDSGGIQEETSVLNVPCLTLRKNTERPVTISHGTNKLIDFSLNIIKKELEIFEIFQTCTHRKLKMIPMWDGCASNRIADFIS